MFLPFFFLIGFLLIFGSLFSISSLSWLGIWIGLEVNIMCFLPLLVSLSNFQVIEGRIKYFLVQSLGRIFLLFRGLVLDNNFFFFFFSFLFFFRIFLKLGAFPLHWWVMSVFSRFSWFGILTLSTWQKLAPFFIFRFFRRFSIVFFIFSVTSSLVGGFCGVAQSRVRIVLGYSTVSHLGWIIRVSFLSFRMGVFYFFLYFFSSFVVIFFLWFFNIYRLNQIFFSSFFFILFFFISLGSLGGIPPFLGFFGKAGVIYFFISLREVFGFIFILLLGSLFSLYFYLGIFFSSFFFFFSFSKAYFFRFFFGFFLVFLLIGFFFIFFDFLFLYAL